MVAEVNYAGQMRLEDCYRIYQGFAKYFGYIENRKLICIASRVTLPVSITEISYTRYERRPMYKVAMDVQMGKKYSLSMEKQHKKRVVAANVGTLKPTTQVTVFMYNR